MKKQLLGILVMMLLLSASALSIAGSEKVIKSTSLVEVIDQHQDWSDDCLYFQQEWQEFVPTLDKLTRVGVKIAQWYSGSPDLIMTIEKPLGTVLTTKSMPATSIPSPNCDWVSFNVPDITLIPGGSYFIKLTAPPGSEYGWGIAYNNLYTQGTSSQHPGDWCFRTYGEEEINNPPDTPSTPSGPSSCTVGVSYTYSTSAYDPDGDQVWYKWDWGNEVSDWDGPYNSGDSVDTSHTWSNQGTYAVKVKAKDTSDAETVWSDPLSISMPKSKSNIPFGFIFVFGFDVDVKLIQLEPGENYVDLEVLSKPFYIWENEIQTRNPGEFIRLYNTKGLFLLSLPFCFGICDDWGIIG